MCIQENCLTQDTYILTPEKEKELKKRAREDYYLRQSSYVDRFREAASKLTEQATQLEHTNPEQAENVKAQAKDANYNADMIEWVLNTEKRMDEKEEIIAKQATSLSEKEAIIEEQLRIIEALKARLNAYGIPYTE